MKLFGLLGVMPQKPFTKKVQPQTVEAADSKYEALGEKPKWTRPEHTIERNEQKKQEAKEVRKQEQKIEDLISEAESVKK